jgi:hypothetical protein
MSRWFRFYDDVVNDPKVQRLPAALFRSWVNLLCVASKNGGVLPTVPDLAFALRQSEAAIDKDIDLLIEAELFDRTDKGIEPHNWAQRQHKSDVSTDRVKRFRKRHETVSETPPEQNRSEQSRVAPVSSNGKDHQSPAAKLSINILGVYREFGIQGVPDTHQADLWLEQGFDPGIVLATIRTILGRKKKFVPLSYFTGAIQEAHAIKDAPKANGIKVSQEAKETVWGWALSRERETGVWPSRQFHKSDIPKDFISKWEAETKEPAE